MPGAGMLIAGNYIYNSAKPDGLTIGHWTGALILQHVMGNKAAKLDGRNIGWLGAPVPDSGTCVFTRASGIRSAGDWFSSKKALNIGGHGPGSSISDTPRLIQSAISPPMKLTEGYQGTAVVRLAMERGEMDGLCGWGWSSVKGTAYDKIKSGELKVVLQATLKRHPELKDVPLAIDYAKDDRGRKLLEVAGYIHGILERVYSVPPGLPKERLRLLQKAFIGTLNDPALLREAKKMNLEISPIGAQTTAKAVNSLYNLNPELVAELKGILAPR
jgi:tripartite-type tricarboxylate transporter receptor subunit TctC